MFSSLSLTAAIASLASVASARIVGLAAPAVIAPNDDITVTLITQNYIQTVKDLSAAFALSPQIGNGGYLGVDFLGEFWLGPDKSNVITNLTFTVTTPADLSGIKYLTGIVNSLYGASNGAVTYEWAVPVTPGTETSSNLNSASEWIDGQCFVDPVVISSSPSKRDENCLFPANTQSLIQTSLVDADALINSIVQNDNITGVQNLATLHAALDQVFDAVDIEHQGEAACGNPSTPPAWPPLSPADSQARAVGILRDAESALQAVSLDVLECDSVSAFRVTCAMLGLVDEVDGYYAS